MDSRLLTPIPTPPAQRWRQFRLLYLPRAMFVVAIGLIAWMWGRAVAPGAIVAEAEVWGADLRAPQAGVLASLKVALNQTVHAGDVVGYVAPANPRLLDATLAVIRAEVDMLNASMAGVTDKQRVELEFERMQITWMGRRITRADLQGKLQQNEMDIQRAEPLYKAKLITEEAFAQLKILHDSLTTQLEETNRLIARLEPLLKGMINTPANVSELHGESALQAAIKVQDAKLKLAEAQLTPMPLTAPIDGVVSLLLRKPGETVMAGDVVLHVTSTKTERLSGFLRQPLDFEPKLGMKGEIRTRGTPQQRAATTITNIGAALEPITPSLIAAMHLPPQLVPETAIRVEFALPKGFVLRPGEHVDVVLH